MNISITRQGLMLDGTLQTMFGGSVHYWRIERKLWECVLDDVIAMGFGVVETYIPWSVHDLGNGCFDFGETDPQKDIGAFLTLCARKGLKALVRPGPHINAEMTNFGYPERIVYDPAIQARTPWGTPLLYPHFGGVFPLPSYTSTKFREAVEEFFTALARILTGHQYPRGGIVALQADNETCFFFRERPYLLDYHPESIRQYRLFLERWYGDIGALNRSCQTCFTAFYEIEPPINLGTTDRARLPFYLDWARFREEQVLETLSWLKGLWRKLGIDVPIYHNSSWQYYSPVDISRSEGEAGMDFHGIDAYPNCFKLRGLINKVRFLCGTSRFPYIPEFGCGVWSDQPWTLQPDEQEFTTMSAIMHGIRGISFYMLAERDRWQGSPITRTGNVRSEYFNCYQRFNAFIRDSRLLEFERKPNVIVLRSYEFTRFQSVRRLLDLDDVASETFLRPFRPPAQLFRAAQDFNFRWSDTGDADYDEQPWVQQVCDNLLREGIDYDLSDDHLPLERLVRYPIVIAASYDFMDAASQRKLADFASQGGRLIFGPGIPYLDSGMNACGILGDFLANGRAWRCINPAEAVFHLPEVLSPYRCDCAYITLCTHYGENSELLFAANASNEAVETRLKFGGSRTFHGLWNARNISGKGTVSMAISPWTICCWKVTCDA